MGLCVTEQPISPAPHCRPPTHGVFTPGERTAQAERGREHLLAATELAGIVRPADDTLAEAFNDAIGSARVQLADAGLESYLGVSFPEELDFQTAEALSSAAFMLAFDRLSRDGSAMVKAYTAVKGTTPRWEIAAAARTSLIYASMANVVAAHAPPAHTDPDTRTKYCDAIAEMAIVPTRTLASQTVTWCADKAAKSGLQDLAEAQYCAAQLDR